MGKHYFAIARPYRDDFMVNSTEEENVLMGEHFQYLKALQKEGKLYLAGPVIDEGKPFGIYIFVADTAEEVRQMIEHDPSIKGGIQVIDQIREVKLSLNPLQDNYPKN